MSMPDRTPHVLEGFEHANECAIHRGGFGLPTILLCAAMALVIAVYIFSVVESPTIWRQTGIIP
jgi:hypothetical protein